MLAWLRLDALADERESRTPSAATQEKQHFGGIDNLHHELRDVCSRTWPCATGPR